MENGVMMQYFDHPSTIGFIRTGDEEYAGPSHNNLSLNGHSGHSGTTINTVFNVSNQKTLETIPVS